MNNKLLNDLKFSLYPLIDTKERHYNGMLFEKNQSCNICLNKICLKAKTNKDFIVEECHNNLLYFKITLFEKVFIVYGLVNDYYSLSRIDKKKYPLKIYFENINLVKKWVYLVNLEYLKFEEEQQIVEQNNSIFIHDIKKVYSIILRKIESYIKNNCENPREFDKCIKNLDADILGIYKSINLLEYQFNIIDCITNPNSVALGRPQQIQIYKALDKLVRIFQEITDCSISLSGTSHNAPFLHQSIITLLFILLDNAIKYSYRAHSIEVVIDDLDYETTKIEISSFSPHIEKSSIPNIFEKYYRDGNIQKQVPEGQGIGLYVAKMIADSLKTRINVTSNKVNSIEDIDYANVTFSFELTHID